MSRALSILTGVLVLQIILYVVVSSDPSRDVTKMPFLSVDTTEIDYIKIRNEQGELVMNRVGVNWHIQEPVQYPANRDYMNTLLNRINEMTIETRVTSNPDRFQLYGLDDLGAKYVEVGKQGANIDKFYSGKSNESYTHTYVRYADSKDVYLVTGTPGVTFSRKPEDWRDKRIWNIERSEVESILIKHPNQDIEVVRTIVKPDADPFAPTDTTWWATPEKKESFQVDSKAINRIFNTLRRFNAADFRDEGRDEIPDFDKAELRIEVLLQGGYKETMDFLPLEEDENRWLARRNDESKTIFVVFKSSVNNLMRTEEQLRGTEDAAS